MLRAEGHEVNHKRIARLCREEGLRVRGNARKRRRVGVSTAGQDRLAAQAPDQVWALDFQFDATSDGRQLKLLNIVDECTREALAVVVARSIDADADATVAALEAVVAARGTTPAFIRMDNGPELTSADAARLVPLRRCRHGVHRTRGTVAKRLRRIVQRPHPRRAAFLRGVRHAHRSQNPHRGLAHRLQREPAALSTGKHDPGSLRSHPENQPGPPMGAGTAIRGTSHSGLPRSGTLHPATNDHVSRPSP